MATVSTSAQEAILTLGASIKAARLRRGWSVRALAERVGTTPTTIGKVERGNTGVAIGTVIEAARIVGIDLYGDNAAQAKASAAELLALLPQRGRTRRVANNDF